jgi:hypothetical protein
MQVFIQPVARLMTQSSGTAEEESGGGGGGGESSLTSISVWSFYHVLWVLPVWGLCYAVSLGCYQSVADEVLRLQQLEGRRGGRGGNAPPSPVDVKRSISGTVYSAFVWVFMFLQMRLYELLLPALLRHAARLLLAGAQAMTLPPALFSLAALVFVQPLLLASYALQLFGVCFGAVVHGWYGFDMVWVALGQEPETRFRAVEEHWVGASELWGVCVVCPCVCLPAGFLPVLNVCILLCLCLFLCVCVWVSLSL